MDRVCKPILPPMSQFRKRLFLATGELRLSAAYRVERPPMDDILSATDAGMVASRARKLLTKGRITHRQYALLDCLLWSCRTPGKATARVSYSILQERAHQARSTIAAGITMLLNLGLIQRTRHRILITGQNGGRVWKQLTNVYRLIVHSEREFDGRTDSKNPDITSLGSTVLSKAVEEAQQALKQIADRRAAQRAADWQRKRAYKDL